MKTHGLYFVVVSVIFLVLQFPRSRGEIGNLLAVSQSFRQTFSSHNEPEKWIWVSGDVKAYYTCDSDSNLLSDKINIKGIKEVTFEVEYRLAVKGGGKLNTTNISLTISTGVDTKSITVVGEPSGTSGYLKAATLVQVNARKARFGFKRPSSWVCLTVRSAQITYRYCPNQTFSHGLVQFPRTFSPPKGSQAVHVFGRCSTSNNRPLSFCESNGTWSYNETVPCRCRTGQIATAIGCFDLSRVIYGVKAIRMSNTEAALSWTTPNVNIPYKVECWQCIGNNLCQYNCSKFQFTPWGNDSRTTNGGIINGLDDTAKYMFSVTPRVDGLNVSEYKKIWSKNIKLDVLPSKVRNLTITKNESGHIVLTWLPPINWPLSNVSYQVMCDVSCGDDNCTSGCAQLIYIPSNDNLLQTSVVVNGFGQTGNLYSFTVFAMNRWQNRSESRLVKWNVNAISYTDQPKVKFLDKGKNFNVVDVVIGVSVLICAVIIAVVVTKCYNKRRARKNGLNLENQNIDHAYSCEVPPIVTNPLAHYVDPNNYENMKTLLRQFNKKLHEKHLKTEEVIGEGEFGVVWKGYLDLAGRQETVVAVKCLRCGLSPKLRRDFLAEASLMGQFNDPNIISLHGVVVKRTTVKIVMEYMSNGSLDAYLLKNNGRLTTLQLLGMARGIAAGMKYLCGKNFIHRDLAARNILVDENLCCKVSDFGLTREICQTSNYETRGGKIPIRWTAPEVIKYKKSFIASDVWSFGVVLWEIMAFGQRPYWKWDNFQVLQEIESGYRLPAPLKCPKTVHCLMLDCWKRERTERPQFSAIVDQLDEWIRSPETINHSPSLTLNRNHNENSQCPIQQWLNSIKMGKYTPNFLEAGYSELNQVAHLTEGDLLNMGIKLVGHRHKIHQSIPLVVESNDDANNDDVFVEHV